MMKNTYRRLEKQLIEGPDDDFDDLAEAAAQTPAVAEQVLRGVLDRVDPGAAGRLLCVLPGEQTTRFLQFLWDTPKTRPDIVEAFVQHEHDYGHYRSTNVNIIVEKLFSNHSVDWVETLIEQARTLPARLLTVRDFYRNGEAELLQTVVDKADLDNVSKNTAGNAFNHAVYYDCPEALKLLLQTFPLGPDSKRPEQLAGKAMFDQSPAVFDVLQETIDATDALREWYKERINKRDGAKKILTANQFLRTHVSPDVYRSVINEQTTLIDSPKLQVDFRSFEQFDADHSFDTEWGFDDELAAAIEIDNLEAVREVAPHASVTADEFYQACGQNSRRVVCELFKHYDPPQSVRDRALVRALTQPTKDNEYELDPVVVQVLIENGAAPDDGVVFEQLVDRLTTKTSEPEQLALATEAWLRLGIDPGPERAQAGLKKLLDQPLQDHLRSIDIDNKEIAIKLKQALQSLFKRLIEQHRYVPGQETLEQAPRSIRKLVVDHLPPRSSKSYQLTSST